MMSLLKNLIVSHATAWLDSWDRFWFSPRHVDMLAVLRIFTGAMLLYGHLVLAKDLLSFIGPDAWIDNATAKSLHDGTLGEPTAAWSTLWSIESTGLIGFHHLVTIVVTTAFMVGFLTRLTGPAALFLQLMVLHRLLGALFGFDQIVTYCAMYLAFTPCGSVWSVDAWLRERVLDHSDEDLAAEAVTVQASSWKQRLLTWLFPEDQPSVATNVATRLLQLHLCCIYLFGGLAKARGELWWDGTALWYAAGNYEYQSVDITFLAAYPKVFTFLSHLTLFWEISYCALIWPRLTRPLTLAIAVAVHGGIAIFLGMITFGCMMIAANAIFVSPLIIRAWRLRQRDEGGGDLSGVLSSLPTTELQSMSATSDSSGELQRRQQEVEDAEEAFKKRYRRLKRREAQVEDKAARLKETKRKIRDRLEDGSLVRGDSTLDALDTTNDDQGESNLDNLGSSGE